MIKDARKDTQSVTALWQDARPSIHQVEIKRTRHLVTCNSLTTECFRSDWAETGTGIGHVIQVALNPGGISAWHCHKIQTDGIFVIAGRVLVALFDGRSDSPTHGMVKAYRLDARDPVLVIIPPGVWHGVKALQDPACFLNMISHPYRYEDPDEWRLPPDSQAIPFDILTER